MSTGRSTWESRWRPGARGRAAAALGLSALGCLGGCAVGAESPVDDPGSKELRGAFSDVGPKDDPAEARHDEIPGRDRDAPAPSLPDSGAASNTDASMSSPADAGETAPACAGDLTDDDGDGTPNCDDECPDDFNFRAMGPCGCGSDDTDTDGDDTPDCEDGCPKDPDATKEGTCKFPFDPSNVDAKHLGFGDAPSWTCDAPGTTIIDSAAGTVTSTSCALGTPDVLGAIDQIDEDAPEVMAVRLRKLVVAGAHVIELRGDRPIVLLVNGDVVVTDDGVIDGAARAATPGPGGNPGGDACDGSVGEDGPTALDDDSGGGGGGGFGSSGGEGGVGNAGATPGGGAGAAIDDTDLVPLRGGCPGGLGGHSSNVAGGAGGGALQISAAGTITIGTATAKGTITVQGGGGLGQPDNVDCNGDGGDGGGSGGGILLEAPTLPSLGALGALRAHGGAGGGATRCGASKPGEDGHDTDDSSAKGGDGNGARQTGGGGGLCSGDDCGGSATPGLPPAEDSDWAGAGGGGGGGRVVLRASP